MKKSFLLISILISLLFVACGSDGGSDKEPVTTDKDTPAGSDSDEISDSTSDETSDSDVTPDSTPDPDSDEPAVKLETKQIEGVWRTDVVTPLPTTCPTVDFGGETSDDDAPKVLAALDEEPQTYILKLSDTKIKNWNYIPGKENVNLPLMLNGTEYDFADNKFAIKDGLKTPVMDLGVTEKFKDKKCVVYGTFKNSGTKFLSKKEALTHTELTMTLEGADCEAIMTANEDVKKMNNCENKFETSLVRTSEVAEAVITDKTDVAELQGVWMKGEPVEIAKSEDITCKTMDSAIEIIFPKDENAPEASPYWFLLRQNDVSDDIEADRYFTLGCDNENCTNMAATGFLDYSENKSIIIPKGTEFELKQLEDNDKKLIDCYLYIKHEIDYTITFESDSKAKEHFKATYILKEKKDVDPAVNECDNASFTVKPIDGCWKEIETPSDKL